MRQRTQLLSALRAEIVGPQVPGTSPRLGNMSGEVLDCTHLTGPGPLFWRSDEHSALQEVLYFARESPRGKYGTGRLWPECAAFEHDAARAALTDQKGFDAEDPQFKKSGGAVADDDEDFDKTPKEPLDGSSTVGEDDLDLAGIDVYHPSSMALTLCVRMPPGSQLTVRLPLERRLSWQDADDPPFLMNGRYMTCQLRWRTEEGDTEEQPAWRREPAVTRDAFVSFDEVELANGTATKEVGVVTDKSVRLTVQCMARPADDGTWIVTVVLRNTTPDSVIKNPAEGSLFQAYFEVEVPGGKIEPYPESPLPFDRLDEDEQSLALLYRDSKTWAIGHGCAAGWNLEGQESVPRTIFTDVLPAVEVPSMTPDILGADGRALKLSMRQLACLPDDGNGEGWLALEGLVDAFSQWIEEQDVQVLPTVPEKLQPTCSRHLDSCRTTLARMRAGLELLRADDSLRTAFRLANLSMLFQQIATKQLVRRDLYWDMDRRCARPVGVHQNPIDTYVENREGQSIGWWRAFQVGFLLMSLPGIHDPRSADRNTVDLIWFPTGGGKTEAYLGAMAVYMFHERLLMADEDVGALRRDGTNVLMRYTLRMLTTQQFQRAASLICAMEALRRRPEVANVSEIPGDRFSLGLWLGRDGSPNNIDDAKAKVLEFSKNPDKEGNPLVLTECPWCRAGIGGVSRPKVKKGAHGKGGDWCVAGISAVGGEGHLLHCTDDTCSFGGAPTAFAKWLPVEVIDERIYRYPPSVVIATADKFAMMAYRPKAGAILGRDHGAGAVVKRMPPGFIVQDELHLISGPLGTMYGLYEAVIERLCTVDTPVGIVRPKRIASTATIRGAAAQVLSLYGRVRGLENEADLQLFPSPGLSMGDSFFGRYARDPNDKGRLASGRLYVGINANEFGSNQTAQVRAFSTVLTATQMLAPQDRDPWWTLLAFYNSLRELGGAQTLVHSDIRSRMSFLAGREGVLREQRRGLTLPHELTSRLSQAQVVSMLEQLATPYREDGPRAIDVCLASNIIEVGVDIDRLSLMSVVGQPKTTAQYIQVTGRVGRRWWDRPGLILTIYSPSRSRDRSHYEQFHSYHRRLYEQVEPTMATPFARTAIERAAHGAVILWVRQMSAADVKSINSHLPAIEEGFDILSERCRIVETISGAESSLQELQRMKQSLLRKWNANPQQWEGFPPEPAGEYLMLWPGQAYSASQLDHGTYVPSSMRNVDASARLVISANYAMEDGHPRPAGERI